MGESLVEIPFNDWAELRDLYCRDWPEHVFAFGIISNYLRWKQVEFGAQFNVKIFCLDGTWRENGTFLLFDEFELYFYSFDIASNYKSLTDALLLVDWESFHEISMDFLEKHRTALDKVLSAKKLYVGNDSVTNFYYMCKEQAAALTVKTPTRTHFEMVSDRHLEYIYEQWSLKDYISESAGYHLLQRLVSLNESVGLFDDSGSLLSWCLRDQSGALSNLQTNSFHFRKGFGRAVCSELARRLADLGDDSYAYVLSSNYKSCELFESIGFQKITNLHWIIIKRD